MNLFVAGPQALGEWVAQMIDDTKDQLGELTPPIDLKVTLDFERADAVIYEEGQTEDVSEYASFDGLPRLCVAGSSKSVPSSPQEVLLFRATADGHPDRHLERFGEAMRTLFQRCHINAFQRMLSGPFTHDVLGALSVVSLSRQLLEAGGDGRLVADRLSRVGSRISMALSDIEARCLCLSGEWPPAPGARQTGGDRIEDVTNWFARTQGERELETSDAAVEEINRAPEWASLVLSGCIDGVARLTRGKVAVTAGEKEGRSFFICVRGEEASLDKDQTSSLRAPERWPLMSPELVPYRLATAAMLMGAAGGNVRARIEAGALIAEMRLP